MPEWKKYIVVLIDEMKVKESLIYDKVESKIIGFIDLGNVNNQLSELEESCRNDQSSLPAPVATHILVGWRKMIKFGGAQSVSKRPQ